jgi:hypothetical protein
MSLIIGLGKGTFAVLVTFIIAVVIALLGALVRPQQAALIAVAAACLPLIVFGLIAAAPVDGEYDDVAIDKLYPVRIIIFLVLFICGAISMLGNSVVNAIFSPKYSAPRTTCRRQILKTNHPTWVQ